MTSRLSGPAVRRASAGPRKQAFRQRMPPLFGSVAVAVADGTDDDVGVLHGYDHKDLHREPLKPLDGGGLWAEIFANTMPGRIQYLGGCSSRTTSFKGSAGLRAPAQATYVATLGSISNTCPPGGLVASSNPVTPQPWAICLAASGTTLTTRRTSNLLAPACPPRRPPPRAPTDGWIRPLMSMCARTSKVDLP